MTLVCVVDQLGNHWKMALSPSEIKYYYTHTMSIDLLKNLMNNHEPFYHIHVVTAAV